MLDSNFNNHESHMYKTTPKEGWKLAIFDRGGNTNINGEKYWLTKFINSDEFIIHEVNSVLKIGTGSGDYYSHVWYEEKKS